MTLTPRPRYGITHPASTTCRSARNASGSRSWPTSATPTSGPPRPTAPTPSRPLALASAWEPTLRLGTAIVPAFTRAPALPRSERRHRWPSRAGPVRARPRHVRERHRRAVERHRRSSSRTSKTRDMVRFLRDALDGREGQPRRTTRSRCRASSSACVPEQPVADPRGRAARGHAATGRPRGRWRHHQLAVGRRRVHGGARSCAADGADKEIVCPHLRVRRPRTPTTVRTLGRYAIAAYLNVPVYAAFHDWLGRATAAGRACGGVEGGRPQGGAGRHPRRASSTSSSCTARPRQCRAHVQRYFDNGVTTTSLALLSLAPFDHAEAVRALAPSAG